ncbi:MAG: hypothetical protein WD688_07330 [Candidatus Binatia bacterium]
MSIVELARQPNVERIVERFRRTVRSLRVRDEQMERRQLVRAIPRKSTLDKLIDERLGYGMLPVGSLDGMEAAVKFAQQVREEGRSTPAKKKRDYNPTILEPKRYEDAPAFFDLILSDNVLQIAADYLGEIPVLMGVKLWCTPPSHDLEDFKGSQMFHRDGRKWLLRRVKFLINMDSVDNDNGPFTFLPADISQRVSESIGSMRTQGRVTDDLVYRVAKPSDNVSLIGPAGTGAAVDSSRYFHFGARVRRGERLLLQFHFLRRADAVHGGATERSPGFAARFGSDRIRELAIPNETSIVVSED